MAHIDEQTFEIYQECDFLTQTCTVNTGDVIRVGCYAFWNGNPIPNCAIILRFMDYYAYTSHEDFLRNDDGSVAYTDANGWLSKNHTVTDADIADLGDNGYVVLQAHSDPIAWGSLHAVNYYRACVVGCEVSCESTCELICQTSCELGCETGCELYCQDTCELSCQDTCELDCQYGCEVSCEAGCEVSCEMGCEVSCETAAEVPITCDGATPNFDAGCDPTKDSLLLYFDTDHDGIISATERDDAWEAEGQGLITHKEAQFVEDAYDAGSINALCSGCFVVPSLVISPTTRSSPAAGDTFTITVTSNIDWTVVNVDGRPWISFTPTSGSGDGTITVTVAENLLAERTGTIRVAGGGLTPTCTITQAGAVPTTCDQPFKLEDQNGDPVEGAEVTATDPFLGTVYGPCTTDSNGECNVTIDEGVDVYGFISALPDGYTGTPTTSIFTACADEKTLVVTKVVSVPQFEFVNSDTQGYLFWDSEKCFAEETKNIPEGRQISVHAQVKNVGAVAGKAYLQVFKTPLTPVSLCLVDSGSTLIEPDATHTFSAYCFDMDDVNMEIELQTYALGQVSPDSLGCTKIIGGDKRI